MSIAATPLLAFVDTSGITGPWPAFLAGMVTSLHCAGMCGPLACFLAPKPGSAVSFAAIASVYHTSRIASYTLVGALAGGLGMLALGWVSIYQESLARFLPWALVLFFLAVAFRVDKWLPTRNPLNRLFLKLRGRAQRSSPLAAGAAIGLLTPLLPCGPLYAVFMLALMTQSPLRGAEFLLTFALGTLPLLYLVQAGFSRWQGMLKPSTILWFQRGLALLTAIVLGIRLYFFEIGEGGLFCG